MCYCRIIHKQALMRMLVVFEHLAQYTMQAHLSLHSIFNLGSVIQKFGINVINRLGTWEDQSFNKMTKVPLNITLRFASILPIAENPKICTSLPGQPPPVIFFYICYI